MATPAAIDYRTRKNQALEARDQAAAALCRSAFEAERQARYQEARQLHSTAVMTLTQLADDAAFMDRERKRIARKQAKFHLTRLETLRPIILGHQDRLQVVLPTSISATESLMTLNNGQPTISLVWPDMITCLSTSAYLVRDHYLKS